VPTFSVFKKLMNFNEKPKRMQGIAERILFHHLEFIREGSVGVPFASHVLSVKGKSYK